MTQMNDEDPGLGQNVCIFDNDICPTISASGVSLSVIMQVPSHTEFFQTY